MIIIKHILELLFQTLVYLLKKFNLYMIIRAVHYYNYSIKNCFKKGKKINIFNELFYHLYFLDFLIIHINIIRINIS